MGVCYLFFTSALTSLFLAIPPPSPLLIPKDLQLPGGGNGEANITPPDDARVDARGGAGGDTPGPLFSGLAAEESQYFSESDVAAVVGALTSYTANARRTLEADEIAVGEGRPLQVRLRIQRVQDACT